jgi:hypothetical protein
MTGAWLSVPPSTVNGTELSAQEFHDALSMRYREAPPDLPASCDGCGALFTLQHALECKCGGLVIFCHNEIKEELVHMSAKAFTPSAVRKEPLIRHGRVAEREKTFTSMQTTKESDDDGNGKDKHGDILIRGFWARGTDCNLDVRVTDTDAKSYCKRLPAKVLEREETKISRGLPGETSALYTFRLFCRQPAWSRSYHFLKTPSSQTCREMATYLLRSMWVR